MTAKEILKKHTGFSPEDNLVSQTEVLAAMKEIAELTYREGWVDRDAEDQHYMSHVNEGPLFETLKALFPETTPAHPGSEPDFSPVSSGTPCTFNVENPDRVEPI